MAGHHVAVFLGCFHHLNTLDEAGNGDLNVGDHSLEHIKALVLISHNRALLSQRTEADALTQLVHGFNVGHPFFINALQDDHAFQLLQNMLAHFGGTRIQMSHRLLIKEGCNLGLGQSCQISRLQVVVGQYLGNITQQGRQIPFLGMLADAAVTVHDILGGGFQHEQYLVMQVLAGEYILTLLIDNGTLLVQYIVIFQHGFTNVKVAAFHLLLGVFQRFADHLDLDGHGVIHTDFVQHGFKAVTAKQTHQIVIHRDIELAAANIALASGTAAQLVINAAALMALGADDG